MANICDPHLVFVLIDDRAEFDLLARPINDTGPKPDGSHVITKIVERDEVRVVFQHWIVDPPLQISADYSKI